MIDKVDVLTEDREDEEKQLLWYAEIGLLRCNKWAQAAWQTKHRTYSDKLCW